jgi:hypothetical protein
MKLLFLPAIVLASIQVNLLSRNPNGGVYMGTIFANNEPIRLVFDTGSQKMTVKSNEMGTNKI